jgi:peptidoglycan/LPS O-acetylase OafA/YrhL
MKNKIIAILGALLFVAAVVVGNFCDFAANTAVEIALAAFALVSVIISTVKQQKEKGVALWKTILIIVLVCVGATLVAIGGGTSNIFEELAGLVVAIIALIIGLVSKSTKTE